MRVSTIFQVCIVGLMCFLRPVIASSPTSAQDLKDGPQCALDCLTDLMDPPTFSPENNARLCHDKKFEKTVYHCVKKNCSVRHLLDYLKIKQITCGIPEPDHHHRITITNFVMFGIALVSVITRIATKMNRFTKWGADDYLIIAAMVFATVLCAMLQMVTLKGLGRNIWTQDDDNITAFYIYLLGFEFSYVVGLSLIKLSILFFFLRTFPDPKFRKIVQWTIGFTITIALTISILAVCQRQPIWLLWEGWKDNPQRGVQLDLQAIGLWHAGMNVALDIWMFVLPLSQLVHLGLKLRKKTGVILIFSVGIFLIAVSCIRVPYVVEFNVSLNQTAVSQGAVVWSSIDIGVGIMVACMPHAQPLLRAAMARARSMHLLSTGSSAEGIFIDRSLATIKTNVGPGGTRIIETQRVEPELQDHGGLLSSSEPLSPNQKSCDRGGSANNSDRMV